MQKRRKGLHMSKHDYFQGINYSLGNEDTSLEMALIKKSKAKKIVSVTGSGGRCLPLFAYDCEELTCADLSKEQQNIAKLRQATYKHLTYHDFLQFWGYAPFGDDDYSFHRKSLFYNLDLESDVQKYFLNIFEHSNWGSLLYKGKWEKTFKVFSIICKKIMGKNYDKIFSFHDIDKQAEFYRKSFPMFRWKLVLILLGNKKVFDALLYKGHFIEKSVSESHFQYYFNAFNHLFTKQIARKSFFLNLCFYGKIAHEDGNPVEAKEETFDLLHEKFNREGPFNIIYDLDDIISTIQKKEKNSVDFISLSDVPSYFRGPDEKNFLQRIQPSISQGGIVVVRSYLRIPEVSTEGYNDITSQYVDLIENETVQMYRIQIFQRQ
jgi:S-adenosylmethionine-diacylglycerol 3-amino-3-carboxypropyl transferase